MKGIIPEPGYPVIPFCKPDYKGGERAALDLAFASGSLEGGGVRNRHCEKILEQSTGCHRALLTPSCTAALEMMALALDLQPGDEVIMPSFTFVSTANAIALRGSVPIYVDIDPRTFNLDPVLAKAAITPKTRAIMLVHYGGVGCDMEAFTSLCQDHGLMLLEDAAQAIGASWSGKPLGSFGALAAISFHHTKNISCGEGGALLINDHSLVRICEFIRDKGTDRSDFLKGHVGKYEWQRLGSSYLLGELPAALLSAQLAREGELTATRLAAWHRYDEMLAPVNSIATPQIPAEAGHNGHIYNIRLKTADLRNECAAFMRQRGIAASPHYVPLHLAPAGRKYGRTHGSLENTVRVCETQLRLPIYSSISNEEQRRVVETLLEFLGTSGSDGKS